MLCISHSSLLSGNNFNWNISRKQLSMKKNHFNLFESVSLTLLYTVSWVTLCSLLTYPSIFSVMSHFGFNEHNCYTQDLSGIHDLLSLNTMYTTRAQDYELIILWLNQWMIGMIVSLTMTRLTELRSRSKWPSVE